MEYDEIFIGKKKEQLIEMARDLRYTINCFYRNWSKEIQSCRVNHTKRQIDIPKIFKFIDLYGFAHELGHIQCIVENIENKDPIRWEELAWDKAKEICINIDIPLDEFDKVMEYSINTHRNNIFDNDK